MVAKTKKGNKPDDLDISTAERSVEGVPAGYSGGGFLTRAQRNQAAFIYDVTRHRCNCNDIESCRDCNANAVAKSLLAADLGIGREY